MAAEDYHDMSQLDDVDFIVQNSDQESPQMGSTLAARRRNLTSRTKAKNLLRDKIARNKFYVGAESALDRNWGHPTLVRAIRHAEEVMEEQGRDEVFVVQIVRVVRRKKSPVEVMKVE